MNGLIFYVQSASFFYTVISIFLKLIICASENFKWQNLMQSVRSGHIDSFFLRFIR